MEIEKPAAPKVHHRSPLQLPDIIAGTDTTLEPEKDDGISKASDNDMAAYSREVANGGNAATMLERMAPPPVKAEDDTGAVALFMSDLSTKADTVLEEDEANKSKSA